MRTVYHRATLFYYDGPQVFEAQDSIGGNYLAVMVEPASGQDRCLVVGVSPDDLRGFRSGILDLKDLLLKSSEAGWYIGRLDAGINQPFPLEEQKGELAEMQFLPESGFFLHDAPATSEVLREARLRENLVLEIAAEPPEATNEHRIRAATLAGLLNHVQSLVKHGYGAALRELSPKARDWIDHSDAHLLDVVIPAAAGSFQVMMEAAKTPDLTGESELARALTQIDKLFATTDDPRKTLEVVKSYRGHFAGAYLRLLRFLVQSKTGLRYSWAQPSSSQATTRSISEGNLKPLVELLSEVSNLATELVELEGTLEKANTANGTWGIVTQEGTFSGKTKEGGPSLLGLKLGSIYRFSCIEQMEAVEGTGREQRTLYLTEHNPA